MQWRTLRIYNIGVIKELSYELWTHSADIADWVIAGASSENTMLIKSCNFRSNGLLSTTSKSTISILISSINTSLYFTNCLFYKNSNKPSLISIRVLDYGSSFVRQSNNIADYTFPDNWCIFPSIIGIRNCNFLENNGPLIDIKGTKTLTCVVRFSSIGPFKIHKNNANSEDLIRIYRTVVNMIGEALFSHNTHARNILLLHYCNVTVHKNISFALSNHCDQVLTLESEFAYIKVLENTNIEFVDNSYNNWLIKVIVQDYIPYPPCFFQYFTYDAKEASNTLLKDYNVKFHHNSKHYMANFFRIEDDDSPVNLRFNYYTFHCRWLPEAIFYGYHPGDINKQIIQTDD